MSSSAFNKIDNALKIYYNSVGRKNYMNSEGVGKFLAYCIENGLEEEDINDEFNGDPSDCIYVSFDEHFPLNENEPDDQEKIFKIIKYCYENGIPPETKDNNDILNKLELQLSKDEYIKFITIYSKQCKHTWAGKQSSELLWYSLCIGLKNNNFPFSQYLTAAYMKLYLQNMLLRQQFDLTQWITSVTKLIKTKTVKIPTKNGDKIVSVGDLFDATIDIYTQRLVSDFDSVYFKQGRIVDDISKIAEYLTESSIFIKSQNKYPFQFELVIALNEISNEVITSDDDSESSSDSEDEKQVITKSNDCIGDIHKNLKVNNCVFFCGDSFSETYAKFLEVMKQQKNDKYMVDYPRKRRIIAFVDHRHTISETEKDEKGKYKIKTIDNQNKGKITIFETANGYREYPDYQSDDEKSKNIDIHVPEWGLEAVRSCIIPHIGYPKNLPSSLKTQVSNLLRTKNAVTACNGKLLTFSFHVEAENQIMCYMWWRSKCILFLPKYIDDFLPKIFQNGTDFKFERYDKCSWVCDQFEKLYQILT
eukprot:213765_1